MIKIYTYGMLGNFNFSEKKIIKMVAKKVMSILKIKSFHEVSFMLVDLETIHKYNLEYRKIDRPTDVISFAYVDGEEDHHLPKELGDILICIEKVKEQAKEYEHSELREFAFLVTHGMLHILGYDHQTEEDEKKMFSLQNLILEKLKITR